MYTDLEVSFFCTLSNCPPVHPSVSYTFRISAIFFSRDFLDYLDIYV